MDFWRWCHSVHCKWAIMQKSVIKEKRSLNISTSHQDAKLNIVPIGQFRKKTRHGMLNILAFSGEYLLWYFWISVIVWNHSLCFFKSTNLTLKNRKNKKGFLFNAIFPQEGGFRSCPDLSYLEICLFTRPSIIKVQMLLNQLLFFPPHNYCNAKNKSWITSLH